MGANGYLADYNDEELYPVYDYEHFSSICVINPVDIKKNFSYWIIVDDNREGKELKVDINSLDSVYNDNDFICISAYYDSFTNETFNFYSR